MGNATLYKIRRVANVALQEGFLARSRRSGSHRLPRQMSHKVLDARLPATVAHIIGFVLQNLPAYCLWSRRLEVATGCRRAVPIVDTAAPHGIIGLWVGAFHVFFPATAAKAIAFLLIAKRQSARRDAYRRAVGEDL
jgi:hypothetical protein